MKREPSTFSRCPLTTEEMIKSTTSALGKFAFFCGKCTFFSCDVCVLRSGVVSTSPLKLEIQFEPPPTIQWYLVQTYVNTCISNFSGSKSKQEVTFDYL
jgi:hypothetical protein